MKRYDVILNNIKDKQEFLDDMQNVSHKSNIPHRDCECFKKRPTSKISTFYLSDEEAIALKKDDRIKSVEVSLLDEPQAIIGTMDSIPVPNIVGPLPPQDSTPSDVLNTSSSINFNAIDDANIIVVDSNVDFDHPEFDKIVYPPPLNRNRTGSRFSSRGVPINWHAYDSIIGGFHRSPYNYGVHAGRQDAYHGTHVASTIAGNINGWAKNSNIFFKSFYDYNEGDSVSDYIRAFHNNGLINGTLSTNDLSRYPDLLPVNGTYNRTKPTITNHSWGHWYDLRNIPINAIHTVIYRGNTFTRPLNGWDWRFFWWTLKMIVNIDAQGRDTLWFLPFLNNAVDTEIQEMIDDGIICVAAAGNTFSYVASPEDQDWNNRIIFDGDTPNLPLNIRINDNTLFIHRGSSPANSSICVGSIAPGDRKSIFSHFGPGIDIYAPGSNITGAVNLNRDTFNFDTVGYPRYQEYNDLSQEYGLAKLNGTSMACPQVCGVLSLVAANSGVVSNPADFDQTAAENWLNNTGSLPTINDPSPITEGMDADTKWQCLEGSPNRYLYYPYATTELSNDKSNALAYDYDNDMLFYIDTDLRMYYYDVSDIENIPSPQLLSGFQSPTAQPGNAAYWNNGIWYFEYNSNILVRLTLSYTNNVPSISDIRKWYVLNMNLPTTGTVGNNTNTFGDITITSAGKLIACTSRGRMYNINILPRFVVGRSIGSFAEIKSSEGNDKSVGLQLSWNDRDKVLYGHNFKTGNWYIVNENNGSKTSINIASDRKYRDLAGNSNIVHGIDENGNLDILNMQFLLP